MTLRDAERVGRLMRGVGRLALLGAFLAVGCAPVASPSASPAGASPTTPPTVTSTARATPSAQPTVAAPTDVVARCVRDTPNAPTGVIELRPDGWFDQTPDGAAVTDFPKTVIQVYAPTEVEGPPYEGPHRLVLYESFPANDAYFESRIERSRASGGEPVDVTVCGETTQVWVDESSGELVVGWTDRDKSDVLVANTADFTVQGLVDSAESVYDCCG